MATQEKSLFPITYPEVGPVIVSLEQLKEALSPDEYAILRIGSPDAFAQVMNKYGGRMSTALAGYIYDAYSQNA